jgi:hypothetical protein
MSPRATTETRSSHALANSDIPYPTARITGRLRLEDGCLMIDQGVAFWPAGTSWNNDAQEVVFGGDFEGATNAPVDSVFVTGGGGLRAWRTT